MPLAEDMKHIVENIVTSYDARIQSIESIFDTTHQLLEGFHGSFLDTRQEREKLNAELRESLARNGSLRKKDFDNMMQGILSTQERREKEVRNLLNIYVNEHKEMAQALRESLDKFKDFLAKGETQRVREFQEMIKQILAKQDQRRKGVTSKLKEFQKEQQEMAKRLKDLLVKGGALRIKDLKSMLKDFKAQHKERVAQREERREKVQSMLGDFKKENLGVAKNWRTIQKNMARRRSYSPLAVNIDVEKGSSKKGAGSKHRKL